MVNTIIAGTPGNVLLMQVEAVSTLIANRHGSTVIALTRGKYCYCSYLW